MEAGHTVRGYSPRVFLLIMVAAFLAFLTIVWLAGNLTMSTKLKDLKPLSQAWAFPAIPSPELLRNLTEHGCTAEGCPQAMPLQVLDFTKWKEKPNAVVLQAEVDLADLAEKAKERAKSSHPFSDDVRRSHTLVLSFGEAYGEYSVWVDGTLAGRTSRHVSPFEKFQPLAGTEAIPIPDALVANGTQRVTVMVTPFQDVQLPALFRMSTMDIFYERDFLRLELLTLLGISASVALTFVLGLYHFFVWLRGRSPLYLGFAGLCILGGLQGSFFFNLTSYLGLSTSVTAFWRLNLLHVISINYIFLCLFARIPVFHLGTFLSKKWLRKPGPSPFAQKPLPLVAGIGLLEGIMFLLFPLIIFVNFFIPIDKVSLLVYKVSMPCVILLSFATLFVGLVWFYRAAARRNINYALPLASGLSAFQVGPLAAALSSIGVPGFSGTTLAFAYPVMAILIAITLGHRISMVNENLKSTAEQLVDAAQQMGSLAAHLSASSQAGLASANKQAASISETTSAINSFAAMLAEAVAQARDSAKNGDHIASCTAHGQSIMNDMAQSIAMLNDMSVRLNEVERVSDEISEKTSFIDDIVFQTQILSFNASIEAAHAGHHGKGFAVVAEEIGKLAQSSGQAADEISHITSIGRKNIEAVVNGLRTQLSQGHAVATEAISTFSQITDLIGEIVDNAHEMEQSSVRHQQVVHELGIAMLALEQGARANLAESTHLSKNATALATQGSVLGELGKKIESVMDT